MKPSMLRRSLSLSLIRHQPALYADVVAIAFIIAAASFGIAATATLEWPYDRDHFRDIAFAQTILNGDWGADPYYYGEYLWYNPLVPSLAAAIAWLGGLDLPLVYARAGAYLNLLGAVMFFALVRRTLGPLSAAAATLAYLFVPPRGVQPWDTATYSPWLFPSVFAQALFYTSLITLDKLWATPSTGRRMAAGLSVGLTFLAHTAPTILLVAMIAADALWRLATSVTRPRRIPRPRVLAEVSTIAAVAILVSLPLTWSVVGHYRLLTLNIAPASWQYELLETSRFGYLLYTHATPTTALALVGVVAMCRDHYGRRQARVLLIWGAVNLVMLARGYLAQLSTLVPSTAFVSDYHFLFYFRGWLAVFAGYGFVRLVMWLLRVLFKYVSARPFGELKSLERRLWSNTRKSSLHSISRTIGLHRAVVVTACALLLIAASSVIPRMWKRADFTGAVDEARSYATNRSYVTLYEWIRAHSTFETVFLSSDDVAERIVAPAGRKVVVGEYFSNPYVSHSQRTAARARMYEDLLAGEAARFCTLAQHYGVRFVILDTAQSRQMPERQGFVQQVLKTDTFEVWQVAGCR